MYQVTYIFSNNSDNGRNKESIAVSEADLYKEGKGYGFVTEENRRRQELLQIAELNSSFEPRCWLQDEKFTEIKSDEKGCYIDNGQLVPLYFKCRVPSQGNYNITVEIDGGTAGVQNLMIFTQRRRLALRGRNIKSFEVFQNTFTVNVCDIIPRGKTEVYEDITLDITIIGTSPRITSLKVEEVKTLTIYIAGDSTLTDQSAAYPYIPEVSYCGWGQMFTAYLKKGVAVSNHAHSGLTTESFRSEGHYDVVLKYIKTGDYFFIQFGHNDQKLHHLNAYGGYLDNLRTYIHEMQEKGVYPVIITPLARNTWKGSEGTYNDLLKEYAKACRMAGEEFGVPVLDLHEKSMVFIKENGLEKAKSYFFPDDYTHSNDQGAYLMGEFIAESIKEAHIGELEYYILEPREKWVPQKKIEIPAPPAGFNGTTINTAFEVKFVDIKDCPEKEVISRLTAGGVITEEDIYFRPEDKITRAEALSYIIKALSFVQTNVYNDWYEDVIGHEWYAGAVECAYQNGLIDPALIHGKRLSPNSAVTWEELISFCVNGYKCRKNLKEVSDSTLIKKGTGWSREYIRAADDLGFLPEGILQKKEVQRREAVIVIEKLKTSVSNVLI